ncbi:hypothetical protein [Streptosporangium jomthongense]|uniref:Uncharacterized protein n=1 Tax=Streptosporangium jomthongense TaxID=1193683 RepID=A0ABV8FGV0_9ACTN
MTLMDAKKKIQLCAVCGEDAIPDNIFGGLRHVMNSFDWLHKAQADAATVPNVNPDPFTIACLALANQAVQSTTLLGGLGAEVADRRADVLRSPWAYALQEVLEASLLHGPEDQRPHSLTEAAQRGRAEAERLIDWALENPNGMLLAERLPVITV